jgi:hypothetical protein
MEQNKFCIAWPDVLWNFFGNSLTWFEMTGGVTFSWGER